MVRQRCQIRGQCSPFQPEPRDQPHAYQLGQIKTKDSMGAEQSERPEIADNDPPHAHGYQCQSAKRGHETPVIRLAKDIHERERLPAQPRLTNPSAGNRYNLVSRGLHASIISTEQPEPGHPELAGDPFSLFNGPIAPLVAFTYSMQPFGV